MPPNALPWPETAYRVDLPSLLPEALSVAAGAVFHRIWRTTLDRPGFAAVRFPGAIRSRDLRRVMLDLVGAMPVRFVPERLGRFDQQTTSRFHRDGAPAASFLLLGYEASTIASSIFVADAPRAALAMRFGITDFLTAHNPMVPACEAVLRPFVTELVVPYNESYLVAINNSLLPLDAAGANHLGVLHRAEVAHPDPNAMRVINSIGLMPADDPGGTPVPQAAIDHFLSRDDLD